jgi:hypothetical protein
MAYRCANCLSAISGAGHVRRGPDSAWYGQCRACHELVVAQLELVADRPSGMFIQIYQCRQCGTARSCRPGWTTRCMICLDDRTVAEDVEGRMRQASELLADPALAGRVCQVLGLPDDTVVPFRAAREAASALAVGDRLRRAARPGWAVAATDVYGLPWYDSGKPHSHGTWGRHEECGTIAKMADGSLDCPACGPEPGSRTHEARRDEPYLLYLVQTHKYQKFGVGDRRRVRTHIRGGAEVVQVLSGPFAHVILAEKALKDLHRDVTVRRIRRGMIESFGQGTEVVYRRTPVSLTQVMPDGEDVTHWFHALRAEQTKSRPRRDWRIPVTIPPGERSPLIVQVVRVSRHSAGMSAAQCIISVMSRYLIRGPLTYELAQKDSPIRQFFDDRLTLGLRGVQADYRLDAGPLLVPGVGREAADPGTIGTAADWMMRFLVFPTPSLRLAAQGASLCGLLPALQELASTLGYHDLGGEQFEGPAHSVGMEPGLLYRACWALALLTEVYRGGPAIAAVGPIGRLSRKSARSLLEAAPEAGLEQLAAFRDVMESALLPAIGSRRGLWAIGPVFAGSKIMNGDADLIAGSLLTELKTTSKKPSLGVTDLWQVLGYVLMDYVDEFSITDVALFSVRYGYLAQWNLGTLLPQLAGGAVTVMELRAEFRALLESCQP